MTRERISRMQIRVPSLTLTQLQHQLRRMQLKNMYKKKTKYIRGSSQMNETEITKEGSIILLNKSIKAVVEFLPEEMQEESVRKLGG